MILVKFLLTLSLFLPISLAAQVIMELPVARVGFCSQPRDRIECPSWQSYLRSDDMGGPIWFLISISGMGCEVDGMVANKLADGHRGQSWPCAWRIARYQP